MKTEDKIIEEPMKCKCGGGGIYNVHLETCNNIKEPMEECKYCVEYWKDKKRPDNLILGSQDICSLHPQKPMKWREKLADKYNNKLFKIDYGYDYNRELNLQRNILLDLIKQAEERTRKELLEEVREKIEKIGSIQILGKTDEMINKEDLLQTLIK